MNVLVKILSHKLFALAVIIGVGVALLVVPAFTGGLGASPLEKLLHQSGEIAVWMLGAVLALTPLRVLFPKSRIVGALNRHRRYIGVGSFVYGFMHFVFHVLYQGNWDDLKDSFGKPFIWFGLAGLTLLFILALTSNNFSIRKLSGVGWKRLHRLAYLAAALLIYHQAIAGKGHWYIAKYLFYPLVALEIARLVKTYLIKKKPAATILPPSAPATA